MQSAETVLDILRERGRPARHIPHGLVTGEPGDRKRSRRVREGDAGKGPKGTSPASYLGLRREAPCRIPGAAGRNSKGGSWVQWLTRIRKVNGTIACQKSDGQVQVLGLRRLRDPCDMAKAGLLEPQSPDDAKNRPSAWHLTPTSHPALAL